MIKFAEIFSVYLDVENEAKFLKIPPCEEHEVNLKLSERQRKTCSAIQLWVVNQIETPNSLISHDRGNIMKGIMYLREICDHPDQIQDRNLRKELDKLFGEYKRTEHTSKTQWIVDHIKENIQSKKKFKTIIFSCFRGFLNILVEMLGKVDGVNMSHLYGSMKIKERLENTTKFKEDSDCNMFIATVGAGGIGNK
jgi:SNF2 family DNA or RNA helicase